MKNIHSLVRAISEFNFGTNRFGHPNNVQSGIMPNRSCSLLGWGSGEYVAHSRRVICRESVTNEIIAEIMNDLELLARPTGTFRYGIYIFSMFSDNTDIMSYAKVVDPSPNFYPSPIHFYEE